MNWQKPEAYAVKHKNEDIVAASRSGGIFSALSDHVLGLGGVVYGCILTEEFQAVHVRAMNQEDRDRMRGSKYIQSSMGETYKNMKADLTDGKIVLFSGTSCQVAGLKGYLGKVYDNLFCVDIVCHGVPSPKVWEEYLKWQEKRNKGKVCAVDFRNKKDFCWRAHTETLVFDHGAVVNSEVFKNLFLGHNVLRPSCYACPYKSVIHPGDITIADYWGIEKAAPEFDDNRGVSLVLVNNQIGNTLFECVKDRITWKKTKLEDSLQPSLQAPSPRPAEREQFWNDFERKPFQYVAKKYGGFGLSNSAKHMLRRLKRKLVDDG